MSGDTLSDVLRAVRLRGAVFYYIDGSCEEVISMTKLMHGLFHEFDSAEAIRGIRRRVEAHLQSGKAFEELSVKNQRYALSTGRSPNRRTA